MHPKSPRAEACPPLANAYRVAEVSDRRGYSDPANVGFTQTGWNNIKSSIRIQPLPVHLVGRAIEDVVQRCSSASTTALALNVHLTRLQTSEVTGFTSEEITAVASVDVHVVDATRRVVARFDASGTAKDSGMDTTDSAEMVITQAVQACVHDFAMKLAGVPTASSSGASLQRTPLVTQLAVRVSRLDPKKEQELFGDDLRENGLIVLEVLVGPAPGATQALDLRRDGVSLVFDDGSSTHAVDPLKVQEHVRVNAAGWAFGFGLIGAGAAMAADSNAREGVQGRSAETLRVEPGKPPVRGLMYFEAPRSRDPTRPTHLIVELRDPNSPAIEPARIPLSAP